MITTMQTGTAPCSRVPNHTQGSGYTVRQMDKMKKEKSMITQPQLTAHKKLATTKVI